MEKIILVVLILVIITVLYKIFPYRNLGKRKPFLAIFPKYKNRIRSSLNDDELLAELASFGFKKIKGDEEFQKYTRSSVLGDFSIKLSKVSVCVRKISENEREVTVQAGWVAAFDTGDHWSFTKELSEKLENA